MLVLYSGDTRELEIRATETDLVELSAKLLKDGSVIECERNSTDIAPYPYLLSVIVIEIIPDDSVKLRVIKNNELMISGDSRKLSILSETIANFAKDWVAGEHIHLEYFEDHPYLAEDSIQAVLTHL